jgi:flagellar protein FliS
MTTAARDSYLDTQVHTATPQRLRLMLIEGVQRQVRAAEGAWEDGRPSDAIAALIRARDIVAELLSGIRPDSTPLVQQTLGIYAYLYSALTEVQHSGDAHQLAGIHRVLEEERQTWQSVCTELPHRVEPMDDNMQVEELAPQRVAAAMAPNYAAAFVPLATSPESLSLEA